MTRIYLVYANVPEHCASDGGIAFLLFRWLGPFSALR
jgi:hypothetical protein